MALEIKEGRFYKTRGGQKQGPIKVDLERRWPAYVEGGGISQEWRMDGTWSGDGIEDDNDLISEWPSPIESPIRTVTRRELVPGVYGTVRVGVVGEKYVNVRLEQDYHSPEELRSAAMILSQIAEFLDEDKGDE